MRILPDSITFQIFAYLKSTTGNLNIFFVYFNFFSLILLTNHKTKVFFANDRASYIPSHSLIAGSITIPSVTMGRQRKLRRKAIGICCQAEFKNQQSVKFEIVFHFSKIWYFWDWTGDFIGLWKGLSFIYELKAQRY